MRISDRPRARTIALLLSLVGAVGSASAQDLSLGWTQLQGMSSLAPLQGLNAPGVGASHLLVSVGLNVLAGCVVISEPTLQVSCGEPATSFRLQPSVFASEYPSRSPEGDRVPTTFGVDLEF